MVQQESSPLPEGQVYNYNCNQHKNGVMNSVNAPTEKPETLAEIKFGGSVYRIAICIYVRKPEILDEMKTAWPNLISHQIYSMPESHSITA